MSVKHRWKETRTKFERVVLIGPIGEGQEALEYLYDRGFMITRSGPYTDKKMHPRVDVTRFLYRAEREIIADS